MNTGPKKVKRYQSLQFKLIAGGIIATLLPLILVGIISINKTSNALTTMAEVQVRDVAKDLALMTREMILSEFVKAKILAEKKMVVDAVVKQNRGEAQDLSKINNNLQRTYESMGEHYEGIIVTDRKGNAFAGSRDGGKKDGKHYSGFNLAHRAYFQKAISSGEVTMGAALRSRNTNEVVSVICSPIKTPQGVLEGTFCIIVRINYFTRLISDRKIGETGYGYMVDQNALMIAHPLESRILKTNLHKIKGMEEFAVKIVSGNSGITKYALKGVQKISSYSPVGMNNWYIGTTQNFDEFMSAANSIKKTTILVGVGSIFIAVIMFFFMAKSILHPINQAVAGLKDIATGNGDLTMRLDVNSKDEIGELVTWFNLFIEKLQEMIRQISTNSKQVNESATELSAVSVQLSSGAEDTACRAGNVATAAEEMNATIRNVASAMEQSTTNTTIVASAAEEMSSTINEISLNAEDARTVSHGAVNKSKDAFNRMSELGKVAVAIGKVTETIREISEQTKLLSLNATIEAARAGDAGKGFAVVANEIKELSNQTAQATLDIKKQIDGMQSITELSINEIEQISEVISGVNDTISSIAAAVNEQSSATAEISKNISEVSKGIIEVNENINQSASVSQDITKDITQVNIASAEISKGSEQVKSSATNLSQMAKSVNSIVGQFKV